MNVIDWDSELKKIEREFDGLPPDNSPADVRERRAAERRAKDRENQRAAELGAWGRLLLVATLGVALHWWPYARSCGEGLYMFLAAEAMLALGGLWVVTATWRARMPKTHALAMAVTLWGIALLAVETLPRIGYAKADPGRPVGWRCAPAQSPRA